jgi:hypothetical protein
VHSKALFLTSALAAFAEARSKSDDVIYVAVTDRFCDGDLTNKDPAGCDPALFDAKQDKPPLTTEFGTAAPLRLPVPASGLIIYKGVTAS